LSEVAFLMLVKGLVVLQMRGFEKGATSLVVGILRGKKPQPGGVQAGYHD
jgi:hypothetical protein